MRHLILAGFILVLSDLSGTPVNHQPYHIFGTEAECHNDQQVWLRLAPEWTSTCKPTKAEPTRAEPTR